MKLTSRLQQIVLVIIVFVVFSPTFFNDFQTRWDDQWMLLEQPFIIYFSWSDLWYHLFNFYHSQFSPVVTVFYLVIYKLFAFNPLAFHAASLFVHAANVLLVFVLIVKLVSKIKPRWKQDRINWYGAIVALIFAVHPLQVESVAWISAIKTLLYSFFFLAGMLFYLKFIEHRNWYWFVIVILCYLLAFGSKEQAIIFPLNIVAIDWILGRYKGVLFTLSNIRTSAFI